MSGKIKCEAPVTCEYFETHPAYCAKHLHPCGRMLPCPAHPPRPVRATCEVFVRCGCDNGAVSHSRCCALPIGPNGCPEHGGALRAYPATDACATTGTPRFATTCDCLTYPDNWGCCATFEAGSNSRCVYCDHGEPCHSNQQQTAPSEPPPAPLNLYYDIERVGTHVAKVVDELTRERDQALADRMKWVDEATKLSDEAESGHALIKALREKLTAKERHYQDAWRNRYEAYDIERKRADAAEAKCAELDEAHTDSLVRRIELRRLLTVAEGRIAEAVRGISSFLNASDIGSPTWLADMRAELAILTPTSAATEPPRRCCPDCGLPYHSDEWLDVTLPDDQWAMIVPEPGEVLLCGGCITKRARKLSPRPEAARMQIVFSPIETDGIKENDSHGL